MDSGEARGWRSWWKIRRKKILIGLGVFVGVVVVFVLMLPSLLSTHAGKRFILGYVNEAIAGKVEVDGIELGWLTGQSAHGVRVLGPDGKVVVNVEKVDLPGVGFWGLMKLDNDWGTVTVHKPVVMVVKDETGETGLSGAFKDKSKGGEKAKTGGRMKMVGPRGVLEVYDLAIHAEGFTQEAASVHVSQLKVDARDLSKLGVTLKGEVRAGEERGLVEGDFKVARLIALNGYVEPWKATIDGAVAARRVPVTVVDALTGQDGLLVLALGRELDVELKMSLGQDGGRASVAADSQNLKLNVELSRQGNQIRLGGAGEGLKWALKREAANAFFQRHGVGVKLQQDVAVSLAVQGGVVPVEPFDLGGVKLDAQLTAEDVVLDVAHGGMGTMRWKQAGVFVHVPVSLSEEAEVAFSGDSQAMGRVLAKATAKGLKQELIERILQDPETAAGAAVQLGLKVSVNDLPVETLDKLTKQEGRLAALLGEKVEMVSVEANKGEKREGKVWLFVKSKNLEGSLQGDLKPGGLLVGAENEREMRLVVSPEAFNVWQGSASSRAPGSPSAGLVLNKPVEVKLKINALSVPFEGERLAVEKGAGDVAVEFSPISGEIPGKGAIAWGTTRVGFKTAALGRALNVGVTGGSDGIGTLSLNAVVANPLGKTPTVKGDAELTRFPVALADGFARQDGKLLALVGDQVEWLRARGEMNQEGAGRVSLAGKSERFEGGLGVVVNKGGVTLDGNVKSEATLVVTPEAYAKFAGAEAPVKLQKPATVGLKVKSLNLPRRGGAFVLEETAADAEMTVGDVLVKPLGRPEIAWAKTVVGLKTMKLNEAVSVRIKGGSAATGRIDVTADVSKVLEPSRTMKATGEVTDFPVALADAFVKQEGRLVALLGERVEWVRVRADVKGAHEGNVRVGVKSGNVSGGVGFELKPGGLALDGAEGNAISLAMKPEDFAAVAGTGPGVALRAPLKVDVKLNGLSLPRDGEGYVMRKLAGDVEVTVGDVALQAAGKPEVTWAKTTARVKTMALSERLELQAKGGSAETGKLELSVEVTKPLEDARELKAEGEVTQFPVALADAFLGQEGRMAQGVGAWVERLKVSVKAEDEAAQAGGKKEGLAHVDSVLEGGINGKRMKARLELKAENVEAKLGVTVDPAARLAAMEVGDFVRWTLTPEAAMKWFSPEQVAGLRRLQGFELTEPMWASVEVKQAQVGWARDGAGKAVVDATRTGFEFLIRHDHGRVVMTRTGEAVKLGAGEYALKSENVEKEVLLSGRSGFEGIKGGKGMGQGELRIEKLALKRMKYEGFAPVMQGFEVESRAGVTVLPVEVLDTYLEEGGAYVKTLGSDLDFAGGLNGVEMGALDVGQWMGPVDAKMTTRHNGEVMVTADIAGDLKDGWLTANRDSILTFMVTRDFSTKVVEKIMPFVQAVGAQTPSKVTALKGYRVPLAPFELKGLQGTLNVELGTLNLAQGGLVVGTLDNLTRVFAPIQKLMDSNYSAKFASVVVTMADGKAQYKGLNMEAGPIRVFFEGDVDYVNSNVNESSMNVKVETFKDFDPLGKLFKPGETVKVSASGKTGDLKLDLKEAASFAYRATAGNLMKVGNFFEGLLGGGKEEKKKEEGK